ncbi:MAG: hypothetical protein EOO93_15755, partial [Pedobacter sp.]
MKIDVVSAVGDPLSPKTWSGTPFNITNVLRKKERLGLAFEVPKQTLLSKLLIIIIKIFYKIKFRSHKNNGLPFRLTFLRLLRGKGAKAFLRSSPNSNMLHFGTLSLPLIENTENKNHYLYIDGTWNLWSKSATDLG